MPEKIEWNFKSGIADWIPNEAVRIIKITALGVHLFCHPNDSQLLSPPIGREIGPIVECKIKLASTADASITLYYGATLSEANSIKSTIIPDGKIRTYSIYIPALQPGDRIRFDPTVGAGTVILSQISLISVARRPPNRWAMPAELREKRLIAAGQYTQYGGEKTVTTTYLADNPSFITRFPYDGIVLTAPIKMHDQEYPLHHILWNTWPITHAHIAPVLASLKRTKWQHLTDNFINVTMTDGADGKATPSFESDADWTVIKNNFRMAARLCRNPNIRGFWLDTEQYSKYAATELSFPLGRDTDDALRRRGKQWIEVVQSEKPDIQILITFAWCPDAVDYGPLKGVIPFLNGILDGIKAPARLHHCYENTFYFGQGPGTTNVVNDRKTDGYPGDRERFALARQNIKDWSYLSANPARYKHFVSVGMAAWVEDHPWNAWSGAPVGVPWSLYSNAALALAYSDRYVWVWSEHTHYAHGHDEKTGINPFLAGLANGTYNTGFESPTHLVCDFRSDPLESGWTFDFDMLSIGGRVKQDHVVDLMDPKTSPFMWSKQGEMLRIDGNRASGRPGQRQRFTHGIKIAVPSGFWKAALTFSIERYPSGGDAPIAIGLFASDRTMVNAVAICFHSANDVRIGNVKIRDLRPISLNQALTITLIANNSVVIAQLVNDRGALHKTIRIVLPKDNSLNEIGTGFGDHPETGLQIGQRSTAVWSLKSVMFTSRIPRSSPKD